MKCSATYNNVPADLSPLLIQTIWKEGGYVLASSAGIVLLAEDNVFYPIDKMCRNLIAEFIESAEPAEPVESAESAESAELIESETPPEPVE